MQNTFLSALRTALLLMLAAASPLLARPAAPQEPPTQRQTARSAPQFGFFEKIALRAAARKLHKALKKKNLTTAAAPGDSTRPCGYLVLYPGERVEAELLEISATEVTYRPCGQPGAAPVVRPKREVLVVVAPNGDELFSNIYGGWGSRYSGAPNGPGPKLDGLALLSFVFGLIPFSIVGPLVAVVCGLVSINRISQRPEKYKGKGLAIAGLILGGLGLLILLITLLSL
jgi:hypothetical protein